jgi:hypothetical protein
MRIVMRCTWDDGKSERLKGKIPNINGSERLEKYIVRAPSVAVSDETKIDALVTCQDDEFVGTRKSFMSISSTPSSETVQSVASPAAATSVSSTGASLSSSSSQYAEVSRAGIRQSYLVRFCTYVRLYYVYLLALTMIDDGNWYCTYVT